MNCTYLEKGDILIARLPEPLGRACIFPLEGKYITAVDIAVVRVVRDDIEPKYLMNLINSVGFRAEIKKYESGTTRKRISRKNLGKIEFSIPDIGEQRKTIEKLEETMSSLDNAVETLNKTKEQLAVYRQAVLKSVFDSCDKKVTVESVCEHVTDGDHMPPPKAATGIPFIMISNIKDNHIDWGETSHVNEEYFKAIGDNITPKKGDILYTVTGSFGISVLVNYDKNFCFQRHIALLRPNKLIEQKFLYYALQAPEVYAQASKRATGTA